MTILEETRHSLIIIEHDPLLYENVQEMVEYVSQGSYDAAKDAAVLLCSPRNFPEGYDQKCRQGILLRRGAKSYAETHFENLSESTEELDNPGGLDMIKLPWKHEERLSSCRW